MCQIHEPLSALTEGGRCRNSDNKVAKAVVTNIDSTTARAKIGAVICLNEALCAHLCASSHSIFSGARIFSEEVKNIEEDIGTPCDLALRKTDILIREIGEQDFNFQ
ncbi:hypothetical protein TcWFU_006637 [Taenia crassiceps]|uniref:Uncharacterized protein n=1 Tax=Taenia crassiceps TaxID=6207 RepID=A0ABR4QSE0_9CEST